MTRGLQDGLLKWWLSQAKFADANVEARVDKEAFDVGDMMAKYGSKSKPCTYTATMPDIPKGAKPKGVMPPKMLSNSVKLKGAK